MAPCRSTILKAGSEGVRRGDRPSEPIEVIIRRSIKSGEYLEERVLRFGHRDEIKPSEIVERLQDAARRIIGDENDGDEYFLQGLGLAVLAGYVLLAKLFWFNPFLAGASLSLSLFLSSIGMALVA